MVDILLHGSQIGFHALQLGCIARLWHDFRLSVSLSVGQSVTDVLWLSGAR